MGSRFSSDTVTSTQVELEEFIHPQETRNHLEDQSGMVEESATTMNITIDEAESQTLSRKKVPVDETAGKFFMVFYLVGIAVTIFWVHLWWRGYL